MMIKLMYNNSSLEVQEFNLLLSNLDFEQLFFETST